MDEQQRQRQYAFHKTSASDKLRCLVLMIRHRGCLRAQHRSLRMR
jgi:hypothetical protein